jgi:WD repeat-containing protein 19
MQGAGGGGGGGNAQLLFKLNATLPGSGDIKALIKWQPDGNFVAIAGSNRQVQIFNRYGDVVDDVMLTAGGQILQISWDKDGEVLAILQSGNSAIMIWDAAQQKSQPLETNMKDLCWMQWSKMGPELAVGSGKGNLIIYNRQTMRMNPLLGKHSKKIACGAWTGWKKNELALASDDKTVSLNSDKGDLVFQDSIKDQPVELLFSETSSSDAKSVKSVSVQVGKKSIWVKKLEDQGGGSPLDLQWPPKHGDIVMHRWCEDTILLVGFSSGYLMAVSTHSNNPGKTLFEGSLFKFGVTGIHVCAAKGRAVICGENMIKFLDVRDWREMHDEKIVAPGLVSHVLWTNDGNFLTVCTADGSVHTYLMSMPVVNAHVGSTIAYMKSLREVLVRDVLDVNNKKPSITIEVGVEPDVMAMGGQFTAMAKNNKCWFYVCDKDTRAGRQVNEMDYNSTVDYVTMNSSMAAVLQGGQVNLHRIVDDPDGKHTRSFPGEHDSDESSITSLHLTDLFLIYATSAGTIVYESLEDGTRSGDFRHICGIKALWSNAIGTRVVVQDDKSEGHMYSPVASTLFPIPEFPSKVVSVLWDKRDTGVFVVVGEVKMSTYKYSAHSLWEKQACKLICHSETPSRCSPIVLIAGELHYQVCLCARACVGGGWVWAT